MNTVSNYLSALREAMKAQGLDALVIPSADPHLSEYLPAHWQARRELSGFTGSVGTFVVTADEAGVWVDSRYWEQATKQLAGSGIELQKAGKFRRITNGSRQTCPKTPPSASLPIWCRSPANALWRNP